MFNIDEFLNWLNEEVEDTKAKSINNKLYAGYHGEAQRILSKLIIMDAETYTARVKEIKNHVCNRICKYPEAYLIGRENDKERMQEERCQHCPVERLVK